MESITCEGRICSFSGKEILGSRGLITREDKGKGGG